jgi:hypothetical protein
LSHASKLAAEAATPGIEESRAAEIARLIWNDRIDAALTGFFIAVVIVILADSARAWSRLLLGSDPGARGSHQAAA